MLNVLIAGVGGQGSVLAAKILVQAAQAKGWQVRTAETIGMAQRGGSVTSHVRMGNNGETIHSPLITPHTADCVIALEPGEGLRALPYLAPDGLLVSAQSSIPSVVASVTGASYDAEEVLAHLRQQTAHFVSVDDAHIASLVGSPKVVNVALLAAALYASSAQNCGLKGVLDADDLQNALAACVRPEFVEMNMKAIQATVSCLQDI